MKQEELQEMYEEGRLDSPDRLRNLRAEIEEHTGLTVPRRIGEILEWWDKKKAVFARKIGKEEDEEETDEEGDQE